MVIYSFTKHKHVYFMVIKEYYKLVLYSAPKCNLSAIDQTELLYTDFSRLLMYSIIGLFALKLQRSAIYQPRLNRAG
jgi:hypothetical protein